MKIVISIGGSVLVPDEIDREFTGNLAGVLRKIQDGGGHRLAVVTGGGRTARKYIEPVREFGASEAFCDLTGIDATRLNARLLTAAIGDDAYHEPPKNHVDAMGAMNSGKIVVMGGTHPGHSTDAVAAMLADYIGADLFINASDVDGIYDKDPKKHKDAKRYEKLSVDQLVDMISGSQSLGAGKYELIDILAVKIIQRSKIRTIFLNGIDLGNLEKAIGGGEFVGTVVESG